jgi:hypothetical protein
VLPAAQRGPSVAHPCSLRRGPGVLLATRSRRAARGMAPWCSLLPRVAGVLLATRGATPARCGAPPNVPACPQLARGSPRGLLVVSCAARGQPVRGVLAAVTRLRAQQRSATSLRHPAQRARPARSRGQALPGQLGQERMSPLFYYLSLFYLLDL